VSVYNVSKYGIALRENADENRWNSVETVTLEWKRTPRSAPAGNPSKIVESTGRVSLIPVEPHPRGEPGGLLANSGSYFAEIELTDDGISTSFYDPAEGAGIEVRYRWDESAHSFVKADRPVPHQ
jgi:hypothetical protein